MLAWLSVKNSVCNVSIYVGGGGADDICWDPQHEDVKNISIIYRLLKIAYDSVNSFIFILPCVYPPCLITSWPIVSIMFIYACVARILINWSPVWGHTEIPGGECHRHEKGFGNETKWFRISVIFRSSGMDTSRYADEPCQIQCACAMVFLLKIGADNHDITILCHEDLAHYWGREV